MHDDRVASWTRYGRGQDDRGLESSHAHTKLHHLEPESIRLREGSGVCVCLLLPDYHESTTTTSLLRLRLPQNAITTTYHDTTTTTQQTLLPRLPPATTLLHPLQLLVLRPKLLPTTPILSLLVPILPPLRRPLNNYYDWCHRPQLLHCFYHHHC